MKERDVCKYYVDRMGEPFGPFSLSNLEYMFRIGRIEDRTLARVEGSDEWVEVWTLVPSRFVIPDDEYPESWKEAMKERAMQECYGVEGGAHMTPFLGGVGLVIGGIYN